MDIIHRLQRWGRGRDAPSTALESALLFSDIADAMAEIKELRAEVMLTRSAAGFTEVISDGKDPYA